MLLVKYLKGEKSGNKPAARNIKIVGSDKNAGQFPPFFQPTPPTSEEEVPLVSGGGRVYGENVQRSQDVFIFRSQVMDLVGQLVRHSFP